ncbi:glycosyltransferase [Hymenobacter rigui]|uniref:Glycosyltransferase family 1 protein n=1 Tax=Hymenobacter rigui TaxID=334424 RepID=A0A3R9NB15_9BACT|nr:glycosyltransferase [Hymenobacter rigui]RSK43079.1 glycosyltransferase family 1 protein [Hymenobacter rigui]
MHQQDIIMLCQQDWHLPLGTNARSLARELSAHNRVLYVNLPLDLNTLVQRLWRGPVRPLLRRLLGRTSGLEQVGPNLWVLTPDCLLLSINRVPWAGLFARLNDLNAWLLARSIRQASRTLGLDQTTLLVDGIIFPATELRHRLRPARLVYYLRDYMLAVPYFRRHGPAAEARLLIQADVVATNSAYLADYARRFTPRSYDIGQGCQLDLYRPGPGCAEPADLAAVPHPRLGYTGFLTTVRLDLPLLEQLARQRPDWHLVLVGPEDEEFRRSPLHGLPNVHFLGRKPPEQLPAYVQHLDVCLNPQAVNEVTQGNYPLKIDEYLAMGKPVVATYTRTMELFADYVALPRDYAGWLTALSAALEPRPPEAAERGRAFTRSHTWAASVARLTAALGLTAGPVPAPTASHLPFAPRHAC